MPYITQDSRLPIDPAVSALAELIHNDGELNYAVTTLIHALLMKRGVNYQNMNNIVGCLDSIKAEFQRMVVKPYEDEKIRLNGYASDLDRLLALGQIPGKTY